MTVFGIPDSFTLGDELRWIDDLAGYKASVDTLQYSILGTGNRLILPAVPDGDRFVTSISSQQSSQLAAGVYSWQAQIVNKFTIGHGRIQVLSNLAIAPLPFDGRSTAEKMRDAALEAYQNALNTNRLYEIAGNNTKRRRENYDLPALRAEYENWRNRVILEQAAQQGRNARITTLGYGSRV